MSSISDNINNFYDISKLKSSLETDQIMLVVCESSSSYSAKFYYYIKNQNQKWDEIINSDAHIGKNGLGKEREGDCKTPRGKYKFTAYFGLVDNPGTKMPYIKLNESHWWNCDSSKKEYNTLINIDEYGHDFDKNASEHMSEHDLAYVYGMNINYNDANNNIDNIINKMKANDILDPLESNLPSNIYEKNISIFIDGFGHADGTGLRLSVSGIPDNGRNGDGMDR